MEQTALQIGNSVGLTIPSNLRKKHGIEKGQKIFLKDTDEGILIVGKASTSKSPAANKEFKKWLKDVLREDAEILDELAIR